MKLDYIDDINEYGDDMVRLYDFRKESSVKFRDLVKEFISSGNNQLDLATVDFIEPRNCNLVLCISDEDEGIVTEDYFYFYCRLTLETYHKMVKMLDPFCLRETSGYQFLYDLDTPTDFLFSPAGSW